MAIDIGELELYPAVETIGVSSNFSGPDDHVAVMSYRSHGDSQWRLGIPMTIDRRTMVTRAPLTPVPNPFVNQWRAVIFKVQPDTQYDVRVVYYDLNMIEIGNITDTVRTRNPNPPIGNIYRVLALDGNDGGSGSSADPWRTIQHAFDEAVPEMTILIRDGHWNEYAKLQRSGLPGKYITIMPYENEVPILSGVGFTNIFNINRADYVRITKGLSLEDSIRSAIRATDCESPIFDGLKIKDPNSSGTGTQGAIRIDDNTRNPIIKGNVISVNSGPSNRTFGIVYWEPGWGAVICDNVITSVTGALRDAVGGGRENYPQYTNEWDLYRNTCDGQMDDGYQIEGGNKNLRIWESTIRGGLIAFAHAPNIIGPSFITRSTVWNITGALVKLGDGSTGHLYIYHITVKSDSPGSQGPTRTNPGIENVIARNNIIEIGRYVHEIWHETGPNDVDYDLMHSSRVGPFFKWEDIRYNSLAEFQEATGQELNGIWGKATFVNPVTGDLRLQPGSPGIDQGVILPGFNDADSPWPFSGAAPDMGAIETGGAAPPPTADFEVDKKSGPAPHTAQFTDRSTGVIDTWYWDFGDGATSSEKSPSHIFHNEGAYDVLLTVSGPGGESSASVTIEVTGPVVSHSLTITTGLGGTTDPTPDIYDYIAGSEVKITALPVAGYRFVAWQIGTELPTNNPLNIPQDIEITADTTITALFEQIPYQAGCFPAVLVAGIILPILVAIAASRRAT